MKFVSEDLKEREQLDDPGVDKITVLKCDLKKYGVGI
jgi:hypothetical protein